MEECLKLEQIQWETILAKDYKKSPKVAGFYMLTNLYGTILYIGKTSRIRRRLYQHIDCNKSFYHNEITHIKFVTEDWLLKNEVPLIELLEMRLIELLKPKYNVVFVLNKNKEINYSKINYDKALKKERNDCKHNWEQRKSSTKCVICRETWNTDRLINSLQSDKEKLKDALEELVDIVQGVIDGDNYKFDSFTLQPARQIINKEEWM